MNKYYIEKKLDFFGSNVTTTSNYKPHGKLTIEEAKKIREEAGCYSSITMLEYETLQEYKDALSELTIRGCITTWF